MSSVTTLGVKGKDTNEETMFFFIRANEAFKKEASGKIFLVLHTFIEQNVKTREEFNRILDEKRLVYSVFDKVNKTDKFIYNLDFAKLVLEKKPQSILIQQETLQKLIAPRKHHVANPIEYAILIEAARSFECCFPTEVKKIKEAEIKE